MNAGVGKIVRVASAVVTGVIAFSGYAGVVGLMSSRISFDDTINRRLPFGSLPLAGLALLAIVAVPMTVASVAAGRGTRYAADMVLAAGLLLVAWIAVELAFIKAYSWFHPIPSRGHRRARVGLANGAHFVTNRSATKAGAT